MRENAHFTIREACRRNTHHCASRSFYSRLGSRVLKGSYGGKSMRSAKAFADPSPRFLVAEDEVVAADSKWSLLIPPS
jgi:hypothetical protein